MLISNLLNFFPKEISQEIEEDFKEDVEEKNKTIEEIRFRVDKPIALKFNKEEKFLKIIVNQEMILKTIQKICDNSIYSFQNQISEGFITVKGGHRIGITGSCVIENGKVSNINYISSLNFRIAKEIKESSNQILKYVLNLESNSIYTTLIVSPPGIRKDYCFKRFNKTDKQGNRKVEFCWYKCRIS